MRMADVNSCVRLAPGCSARISHTALACVTVTSLSTPRPAITATMPDRSALVATAASSRSSSDATPVRCDQSVAQAPSTAVRASPTSVPNRADVVRIEMPWAR